MWNRKSHHIACPQIISGLETSFSFPQLSKHLLHQEFEGWWIGEIRRRDYSAIISAHPTNSRGNFFLIQSPEAHFFESSVDMHNRLESEQKLYFFIAIGALTVFNIVARIMLKSIKGKDKNKRR